MCLPHRDQLPWWSLWKSLCSLDNTEKSAIKIAFAEYGMKRKFEVKWLNSTTFYFNTPCESFLNEYIDMWNGVEHLESNSDSELRVELRVNRYIPGSDWCPRDHGFYHSWNPCFVNYFIILFTLGYLGYLGGILSFLFEHSSTMGATLQQRSNCHQLHQPRWLNPRIGYILAHG